MNGNRLAMDQFNFFLGSYPSNIFRSPRLRVINTNKLLFEVYW